MKLINKREIVCKLVKCNRRESSYLFIIWIYVPSEIRSENWYAKIKRWFINWYIFDLPKLIKYKIRP